LPSGAGFDICALQDDLAKSGFSYQEGLPDGFDFPGELSRLGPLIPQYSGELVRDVAPDPDMPDGLLSAYSTDAITPHTEWYEFAGRPPRYVALWGVFPARGPGGETLLADGYRFLETFAPADQRRMRTDSQRWRSTPTLARYGVGRLVRHPILEPHPQTPILRFSTHDLIADSEFAASYIATGLGFFAEHHLTFKIAENAVLIWDNWRMLHGRTAFTDRRRLLRRVLIGAT
jgi:hypothetical protein